MILERSRYGRLVKRAGGSRGRGFVPAYCLAAFCYAGPLLWWRDPTALDVALPVAPPSWANPLGTDDLGRDQLARLMDGGAATLNVAIPGAALALLIGVAFGLTAGLAPALVDRALMRLLDALLALPGLLVLLCLAAVVPLTPPGLIVALGVTGWTSLARLVRNETVAGSGRDYVLAARQLGGGRFYIARRHVLPNMARLLAVQATFLVGDSILALSALSFLGLGVPPPQASWGQMMQSGLGLVDLGAWWLILPPGLLIMGSLWSAAALGRSLRPRGWAV